MNNETSFNGQQEKLTGDELLEGLLPNGKYSHLRIILSKNNNREFGQRYLMITPSAFGVVKLINVDYNGNKILLDLQDCITGMVKQIPINVNDKSFNFLLISWDDIRRIVLAENKATDQKNLVNSVLVMP
jgi:hypothetical protein